MGLFDTLRCHYPLPVAGANDLEFQSKSTPAQLCDEYEIRADGSLWHREYDQEDCSNPDATGIDRLIGMAARVNERWVPDSMTGELRFYTDNDGTWLEFEAQVVSGRMVALTGISPPLPRQLVPAQAMAGNAASNHGDSASTLPAVVHCVVEFDRELGKLVGRIVGFLHVEHIGTTFDEVEQQLRQTVGSLVQSGSLVLETTFVAHIAVPVPGRHPAVGDAE